MIELDRPGRATRRRGAEPDLLDGPGRAGGAVRGRGLSGVPGPVAGPAMGAVTGAVTGLGTDLLAGPPTSPWVGPVVGVGEWRETTPAAVLDRSFAATSRPGWPGT
ncbi:hypothetical protein [Nocardioides sp. Leaf374]|uniref:hypothetical protein n=1 Tax=Nocardioides sp. Leaf374 TaxID=2876560 RepID=UPI001E3FFAD1|nr:hypothetical protein [Nocardioides sp. Leaf374]